MTHEEGHSTGGPRSGMSARAKARLVAFIAYGVGAIALGLGNYTYYLGNAHHDRSGDRFGFVIWTLIGIAFVAGTLKSRWLAIGSCVVAGMGFFMFITYPLHVSLSHFWGQALAMACYVAALVSSVAIMAARAERGAAAEAGSPSR